MTTSTPPAWHFLEEKYVPVKTPGYYPADVDEMCREYGQMREDALSEDPHNMANAATVRDQNDSEPPAGSHKTPESDALRERNDSSDALDAIESIHEAEREGTVSLSELRRELEADPTGEDVWPLDRDQCLGCRCAPNMPHADGCERTAQLTDAHSNAAQSHADGVRFGRETPTKLRVGAPNEHPAWTCDHVPFKTQEFMFEELCEEKIAELPHLIFEHSERIIEMARNRFRAGYAKFGSEMYSWTPERRLDETLQELADAVVYLTSGGIE